MSSFADLPRFGLVAALILVAGASTAHADSTNASRPPAMRLAQSTGLPPSDIPDAPGDQGADPAALVLRIDRLENQLRAANGAIEELENRQHQLEERIKNFQQDVEFRLSGGKGAAPAAVADAAPAAKPIRRSDAFDPAADPNAPGAPRPIGTTPPSPPLTDAPAVVSAPLDLSHNNAAPPTPTGPLASAEPNVIPGIAGPPDDPREQINVAVESLRSGQYDQAEKQFRAVLAKNPGGRLASEATFYLGETFLQRSRPREAAEQYLKVTTDYAKSLRAPEAMLRLGQSLAALGNNDQACATFGEIGRRYPTAAAGVKKNVEREMQKDHCTAQ